MGRCRTLLVILSMLISSGVPGILRAEPFDLRVMAANTSSGRWQSYPNPGPGVRFFQALEPDVVLIQEFNVNTTRNGPNDTAAVDRWVDEVFGPDFHWYREADASIPNGVISRFPILESGEWSDPEVSNRDFAYARLDLPGDRDLWVVSVHFLTRGSRVRNREGQALLQALRQHPVPDDALLVLGGDFNTDNRNEPVLTTLAERLDTLAPFPDDGADPPDGDTNSRRRKPYDWVLVDSELEALEVGTEVGGLTFPNGLVLDSRVFTQSELDEHLPPIRQGDSDARQMQHMAVVRDFRLGDDSGDALAVSSNAIDFGLATASQPPRIDTSTFLEVRRPVSLVSASFGGLQAEEFTLADPDLSAGPVLLGSDTGLTFTWSPGASSPTGGDRQVTVTLVVDEDPGAVEITLRGRFEPVDNPSDDPTDDPSDDPVGEPIDLSGYRVEQIGGNATLILPPGTTLDPGAILVIGRAATREAFEGFWGPLDPDATYLVGQDLAGSPGFPILNGGERFRLVDPLGAAVDPTEGRVPVAGLVQGEAVARVSTAVGDFTRTGSPMENASPGRFEGTLEGTGRVVISEVADAPGAGNFVFEFVELVYDPAASAPTP